MKLLFTGLLFAIPFFSFAQVSVNYSMLDSNENAVLRKTKELEYSMGVRAEITGIERTADDNIKLTFKKHDVNATTYDYDTYVFDKADKCKTVSTKLSLGRLSTVLAFLRESGFRTTGENVYYSEKENTTARVEHNVTRKTLVVTYTRK